MRNWNVWSHVSGFHGMTLCPVSHPIYSVYLSSDLDWGQINVDGKIIHRGDTELRQARKGAARYFDFQSSGGLGVRQVDRPPGPAHLDTTYNPPYTVTSGVPRAWPGQNTRLGRRGWIARPDKATSSSPPSAAMGTGGHRRHHCHSAISLASEPTRRLGMRSAMENPIAIADCIV